MTIFQLLVRENWNFIGLVNLTKSIIEAYHQNNVFKMCLKNEDDLIIDVKKKLSCGLGRTNVQR